MGTLATLSSQLKSVLNLCNTLPHLVPPLVCGLATVARDGSKGEKAVEQPPKRPGNPYSLFVKDNFAAIRAKHPNLKITKIMAHVAQAWKNLAYSNKQEYFKRQQTLMQAYKKQAQAEEPPKKPLKPYAAYAHDNFTAVKKGHQNLNAPEIQKIISEKWHGLDAGTKERYGTRYKFQLDRYFADLTEKDLNLIQKKKDAKKASDAEQLRRKYGKAVLKAQPKPKRRTSAYIIFLEEKKGFLKGRNFMKEAGEEWKKLSDAQKEVYSSKADERRKAYKDELQAWERLGCFVARVSEGWGGNPRS